MHGRTVTDIYHSIIVIFPVYYDSDGIYSVCRDYFVQVVDGYISSGKTYFSTDLVSRNDISLQCIRMV